MNTQLELTDSYKHLPHYKWPEFSPWRCMIRRCSDTKWKCYANYGGRGIRVCKRWRESFEDFVDDMGVRPSPKHTIERRNTNGNYEPSNCYWATMTQQNRNTRRNTLLTFRGETKSVSEWAGIVGIPVSTLFGRIHRLGLPADVALTMPNMRGKIKHRKTR